MAMSEDGRQTLPDASSAWPTGGGRMGERIRAFDWSTTPLGSSESWQQSLRSAVDLLLSSGFPMMVLSGDDLVRIYNDACADLIGPEDDGLGRPLSDGRHQSLAIDPAVLKRVAAGETVTSVNAQHPILHRSAGGDQWINASLGPARNEAGEVTGAILIAFDVSQHMQNERRLAAELQHRVRNNLSIVRSIARRTYQNSDDLEEFAAHLDGRLGAFGRTQSAATRYITDGLDLHSMVLDELVSQATQEGDRLSLSGPEIRLRAKAAGSLGLAFHELATNAVKFGALSVDTGFIAISWRVLDQGDTERLVITWQESRPGPALEPPIHEGFGTELLTSALDYELEAETSLIYDPTGLRCTIDLPLAANVVAAS